VADEPVTADEPDAGPAPAVVDEPVETIEPAHVTEPAAVDEPVESPESGSEPPAEPAAESAAEVAPAPTAERPRAPEVASGSAPGGGRTSKGRGTRGAKGRGKRAYDPADFANLPVPDELLKFNALLAAERQTRSKEKKDRRVADTLARAVSDAEKAKEEAAARVRRLQADPSAGREAKAEADQAYKDALTRLSLAREGKLPEPEAEAPATDEVGEPVDTTTDEATDETTGAAEATDESDATDESAGADEPAESNA
jgi:hypothetical protein